LKNIDEISKSLEIFFKLRPENIKILTGGTNNRVFRFQIGTEYFIVKSYLDAKNSQDRMSREIKFLVLCADNDIDCVPKIKFIDNDLKIICETYIPGTKISSASDQIEGMLNFVLNVNSTIPINDVTFVAIDSNFTCQDLFESLNNRISLVVANNSHEQELKANLNKLFELLLQEERKYSEIGNFYTKFSHHVISPSDLGPENILFSGKPYYIDFEYSGIDSNVKLGLDLVTRPSIRFNEFKNTYLADLFDAVMGFSVESIPLTLIKVFKLKWILIEYSSMIKRKSDYSSEVLNLRTSDYGLAIKEMINNFART
jgi:tRNA A-37 threonylcarbamoyl transferase component Bud32